MKDMRTKKKRKPFYGLRAQLSWPILIILVTIAIVTTATVFMINFFTFLMDSVDECMDLSHYATKEMEDYQSLDWLVKYWDTHAEEMDIIYSPGALKERETELRKEWPEMPDLKQVNALDIGSKDPIIQKMYAEVVYGTLSHDLSRIKRIFRPKYLYSFFVQDDEMHFLVTGALEDEKHVSEGGMLFELGSRDSYIPGNYAGLDYVIETHEEYGFPTGSSATGEDNTVVHFFTPVFSNGKFVAIMGIAVDNGRVIYNNVRVSIAEVIILVIVFLFVALWLNIRIRLKVADPLRKTEKVIKEYENKKDGADTKAKLDAICPNNEVQSLAEGFSSMVDELGRYVVEVQKIAADKERIETELNVATKIQADMLPSVFPPFPDRNEFDLFATMDPAKEVGGDFYDFFFLDENRICLVIADVSGKGVPAALFMVISKTLLRSRALAGGTLSEVLYDVNNQLCEGNDLGYFVTVWMAVIDLRTGEGVSVNAGHEHPAVKPAKKQYEFRVYPHSPALGLMEGIRFKERTFKLNPGDRIFVYTDGVPEATNNAKKLFENDRLKEALDVSDVSDPENVCRTVREHIDEFVDGAEQFDDITMLTFLYKGSDTEAPDTSVTDASPAEDTANRPEDVNFDTTDSLSSGMNFKTIVVEEITE
ncbi:MAG: PP2C family protein-serine/threonine phosphatase [Lachnospiraceae bacterium]|nr:PP2C family protein-serine/threonine phosphatase [Lachnospiraceae bacterium]